MKGKAILLATLFIACSIPLTSADDSTPITINVDWTDSHAYVIKGDVDISEISITHIREGGDLGPGLIFDTTGDDLRVIASTDIAQGDTITVEVEGYTRTIQVGLWGQPIEDHEVTLNTQWEMDQQWENENGSQKYILIFDGQGWQQRVGNTLESWEMGEGELTVLSNTEEGRLSIIVDLESIWKNETTVDGLLTGQIFDARGSGSIEMGTNGDDGELAIQGSISDAWINRSMVNGMLDERFRLEANGSISLLANDNDSSMDLSGDLAVLLIETWDSDGERRLSHTQFEATADLMLEDNETRMDISLDSFESNEKWVDGVRITHLNKMVGQGTFGYAEADENSSVQINGTIHDFHQEQENGFVTVDDLHISGRITGDAQGTFGVVRGIEDYTTQANETGVMYDVIIVHQEDWFNLTGISGLPNSGLGAGAHHNESWSYDAKQSDWDNRTIRTVWSQTGPDPSSGDIVHSNSPIQNSPEPPEVEEAIGDVDVGRESGFTPIDVIPGDIFSLSEQDGMTLTVTAGNLETIQLDGHLVDTVMWTGIYSEGVIGDASGNLIIDGPLSGLNVVTKRNFMIEFGEDGEMVNLTENQSVSRVLSPSIISIHDNSPPVIEGIALAQGVIVGENGAPGNIEVTVSDIDFNVVSVNINAQSMGYELPIELNDKGLDGDRVIGDDIWTASVSVSGLEFGELPINVTVSDAFDESDNSSANITVLNQAPRLTSVEIVPTILSRGEELIINAEVYDGHGVELVSVDMRDYGGEITDLSKVGDLWIGQVQIPVGMSPGDHKLKLRMTDAFNKSITVEKTIASGQYHIPSDLDKDIEIRIMNEAPVIDVGGLRVIEVGNEDTLYTLTVSVDDYDGLNWVKIRLGILAPPGESTNWFTMTSNGDGTYSIEITVKSFIALGTHELIVKAEDSYGSQSAQESIPVQLTKKTSVITGAGEDNSNFVFIAIGALGMIIIGGIAVFVARNSEREGGLGGFGDV